MSFVVEKIQVKKIKGTYRAFCFFICICSVIGFFGALTFGTKESLIGGLAASIVPLILMYVCVPIAFKGYPPKILMWTLESKN